MRETFGKMGFVTNVLAMKFCPNNHRKNTSDPLRNSKLMFMWVGLIENIDQF